MTNRLTDHTKDEWFDIARKLMPGLTHEEYEVMHAEFMVAKQAHLDSQATGTMQ